MEEYLSDEKGSLESSYITLRTMASDIEALKKSGGDVSRISKYAMPIHVIQTPSKEEPLRPQKEQEATKQQSKEEIKTQIVSSQVKTNNFSKMRSLIKIISVIIIILLFFAFGYFILPKILPQKITKTIEPQITTTTPQLIK